LSLLAVLYSDDDLSNIIQQSITDDNPCKYVFANGECVADNYSDKYFPKSFPTTCDDRYYTENDPIIGNFCILDGVDFGQCTQGTCYIIGIEINEKHVEEVTPEITQIDRHVIGLNAPSDREHNIATNEHPNLKVWWELDNWADNERSIAHIESIELISGDIDMPLVNLQESRIAIKGQQVFDNLISGTTTETRNLFSLEPKFLASTVVYDWNVDTSFLFEGDKVEVDYVLEKVIVNPSKVPIILLKIVFLDDEKSIKRILEKQTFYYTIKVTFIHEDLSRTMISDSIAFVVYDGEKPEDYSERYNEKRLNHLDYLTLQDWCKQELFMKFDSDSKLCYWLGTRTIDNKQIHDVPIYATEIQSSPELTAIAIENCHERIGAWQDNTCWNPLLLEDTSWCSDLTRESTSLDVTLTYEAWYNVDDPEELVCFGDRHLHDLKNQIKKNRIIVAENLDNRCYFY